VAAFAFDLLEFGRKDLRDTPLEKRKGALAKLVRKASWAVQLNKHIAERGDRYLGEVDPEEPCDAAVSAIPVQQIA